MPHTFYFKITVPKIIKVQININKTYRNTKKFLLADNRQL